MNKAGYEVEVRFFPPLRPGTPQKFTPTPRRRPPMLPLMLQPVDESEKVTSELPPPPYEEGEKVNAKLEA